MIKSVNIVYVFLVILFMVISTSAKAKTYEIDCDTTVCEASNLAVSFINKHSSFFDFSDNDIFVVYDKYVVVDSITYLEIKELKLDSDVNHEWDKKND
ncbi:hypothetical protein [Shewanella waksmanii]|uniref:hypothetical protein n=1 Tax=Shewanella waksmanii TaxID=213783 RepID=UPI000491A98A|nr:hypothetical protein [Shewanella waksmanii]